MHTPVSTYLERIHNHTLLLHTHAVLVILIIAEACGTSLLPCGAP